MASNLNLKLSNRGRKGAVKRLPATVDIPNSATVEDVQIAIAKQAGVGDYNRLGIFNPKTNKIISDRRAIIGQQDDVVSSSELRVQDLGLQMSWRTVFLVEYFGPVLAHALIFHLRPYIWIPWLYENTDTTPLTVPQQLVYAMFQIHFVKRELETAFLHKFSKNTMPAWNIFRNSAYYWLEGGLAAAASIYATWSPFRYPLEQRTAVIPLDYLGVALFVVGELLNLSVHLHLASLRKTGGTEKGIPNCIGSSLVTCPNYMFEVIAWIGMILISRDLWVVATICTGGMYMRSWSKDKERDLRRLFPDRYKKKRYTMVPGLI